MTIAALQVQRAPTVREEGKRQRKHQYSSGLQQHRPDESAQTAAARVPLASPERGSGFVRHGRSPHQGSSIEEKTLASKAEKEDSVTLTGASQKKKIGLLPGEFFPCSPACGDTHFVE
jgi:hypothetical protein